MWKYNLVCQIIKLRTFNIRPMSVKKSNTDRVEKALRKRKMHHSKLPCFLLIIIL